MSKVWSFAGGVEGLLSCQAMANPAHVALLKEGSEKWNQWRKDNPSVRPDLSGADLKGALLYGADLYAARLSHAQLIWADLSEANLIGADLKGALLCGAHLKQASL